MIQLEHNVRALRMLDAYVSGECIPHAILLEAPRGCGKKTMAALIAQAALCSAAKKPCGICPSCVKVEKHIHPDVRFYTVPDGKKEFPIELVREIRQEAYIAPNEGICKLYVLDKAHMMNISAQNALLKLIEEPPSSVLFILLCENRSMMLVTMLSRVTVLELEQPSPEQCAAVLDRLVPETDASMRQAAAEGAGGNIGIALELLGTAKPSKAAANARILRAAFIEEDRYRSICLLSVYDKDREGLLQMFSLLAEGFMRLGLARYRSAASDEDNQYANRITVKQAADAAQAVETAAARARRNVGIPLLCACLTEEVKSVLGQ